MSTIYIDIGFVVIIFVSLLIGAYRGFVRSFLSVVSWTLAAWITWKYGSHAAPLFAGFDISITMQFISGHIVMFFGVLLLTSVISAILARSLATESLSGIDTTLGTAFGVLRGVLIALVLAVVGSFTFIIDSPWWQDSIVLTMFEPYVFSVRTMLAEFLTSTPPAV